MKKKRIWLLPIEPLETRYTAQWIRWYSEAFAQHHEALHVVHGGRLATGIEHGQFLDAFDTHYWKATQCAEMVKLIRENKLNEEDVLVFLDGWNPAVESFAYIRDTIGIPFKMVGIFHAGTWDPWDFLAQRGLARWASGAEASWMHALDAIVVATQFHKNLIIKAINVMANKIHVTGFPLQVNEWQHHRTPWAQREPLVVFPHRMAPEKDPELFHEMIRQCKKFRPDIRVVETLSTCKSKDGYYRLLGTARVVVSTAKQETWGMSVLEAFSLGAWPVVPNRLSYPETLPDFRRYETTEEAVEMILDGLSSPTAADWDGSRTEVALKNIADVCGSV